MRQLWFNINEPYLCLTPNAAALETKWHHCNPVYRRTSDRAAGVYRSRPGAELVHRLPQAAEPARIAANIHRRRRKQRGGRGGPAQRARSADSRRAVLQMQRTVSRSAVAHSHHHADAGQLSSSYICCTNVIARAVSGPLLKEEEQKGEGRGQK